MELDEITETTFAFRLSNKEKLWLGQELERLKKLANKARPNGTRVISKNKILLNALKIGFEKLKAKY